MMLNSGVSLVALDLMLRDKILGCQLLFELFQILIFFSKLNCAKVKKISSFNLREIKVKTIF